MKLTFSHQFELASPLSRRDALAAMQAHTEPAKRFARVAWPDKRNDLRFEGAVTDGGFDVRRIMGYRNGFAPRVIGVVHPGPSGSRIAVTMQLQRSFVLLMAISLLSLVAILAYAHAAAIMVLALILPLYYALALYFFWREAELQQRSLQTIFQSPA